MKTITLSGFNYNSKTKTYDVLVSSNENLKHTSKREANKTLVLISQKLTKILYKVNDSFTSAVNVIQRFIFDFDIQDHSKYLQFVAVINERSLFILHRYTGNNNAFYSHTIFYITLKVCDLVSFGLSKIKKVKYTGFYENLENIYNAVCSTILELKNITQIELSNFDSKDYEYKHITSLIA